MKPLTVSVADATSHAALRDLYVEWGYDGGIAETDTVFVAEAEGRPVGLVRRTEENGILMLRGCFVDPSWRGQGIGTHLLREFVRSLPHGDCFCVPFEHLVAFYGREGFLRVPEASAPGFLQHRLARYREAGHVVTVLCRRADGGESRAVAV